LRWLIVSVVTDVSVVADVAAKCEWGWLRVVRVAGVVGVVDGTAKCGTFVTGLLPLGDRLCCPWLPALRGFETFGTELVLLLEVAFGEGGSRGAGSVEGLGLETVATFATELVLPLEVVLGEGGSRGAGLVEGLGLETFGTMGGVGSGSGVGGVVKQG
jgi:hypothetical protein